MRVIAILIMVRLLETAMTFMWQMAATITQTVTHILAIRIPMIQELPEINSSQVNAILR
jgi:hypothetical protein